MDELFPWDFIDIGVTKNFLKKEWERAMNAHSYSKLQNAVFRLWCGKIWKEVSVLKARIKFKKYGVTALYRTSGCYALSSRRQSAEHTFRSHYTGGYSPHMIMSFANPLGIGITSDGRIF